MSIDFEKYKALVQQLDDYTDIYTDLHPPILYDAVDAINELMDYVKGLHDQHIKIQYHNEELTIREICERLDDLQNKVNKYECEIRKYTESCEDCNFCKMED